MNQPSSDTFVSRHIGPRAADLDAMLKAVGAPSLDALIGQAVPASIRLDRPLALPEAESEHAFLGRLRGIAAKNQVFRSYIGMGYANAITPAVVLRNVFENPGWYTPYTPYQAEIAQGRLESLLNFQTMVKDLTGMEVANASLLDEATAAAEAMTMIHRLQAKRAAAGAEAFLVSERAFPQTIELLKTRAEPFGIELRIGDVSDDAARGGVRRAGAVPQRPRRARGPRRLRGAGARRGRPRGGRHGSARAHARHAARGAGRRRGVRQLAALRRAARLRRPARGVLRHPRGLRAPDARPRDRRVGGRAGPPGLPHGPADARAAHPAGEGDLEHLHRPGAAGQHGRHVRRLPRARGPRRRSRAACTA